MRRFRFPIAVAATSLALVVAIGAIGALTVRSALANAPWVGGVGFGGPGFGGPGFGGHGFGGPGFELPPELQGLHDLPPAERFAHFTGVQLSLKDKDNKPFTVTVTPGTATAVSATSLTLAANDGTTKTFTLDSNTMIRGKPVQGGAQATQSSPALANGDLMVVVTLNNSTTARAIMNGGKEGFGSRAWGR
jgi:hypothetical protein